jgi:glycerol kinase
MLMNTGERPFPSTCGLLTTLGYKLGDAPAIYALEGSISIAGALVQWLRDNLGIIAHASEIEALARTVSDNGDVYFVPAFSGLYAPHWKDSARGVIAGLTRFANKGHIARAALEATAFQTREVLDAMTKESGVAISELRTTALGAAYAAGLAVGYWDSTQDIVDNWGVDKRWHPMMDETTRARLYASWNKAVSRSFDWANP